MDVGQIDPQIFGDLWTPAQCGSKIYCLLTKCKLLALADLYTNGMGAR